MSAAEPKHAVAVGPVRARARVAIVAGLATFACAACHERAHEREEGAPAASASAPSASASLATATSGSTAAPGAAGTLTADLDGRAFTIAGAKVVPYANYLQIVLSSGALDCDKSPKPEDVTIELSVAPGPGGKFYAGQKQGVPVRWDSQTQRFKWKQATPYQTVATIEPFELAAGAKVKGTLAFALSYVDPKEDAGAHAYKASGAFEAPICSDPNGFKTLVGAPVDAGDAPFGGAFGSAKFTYKKALAVVFKDLQSREEYVESIELFDDDTVDCKNRYDKKNTARYVSFTSIGGAGASHVLGGVQSADASFSVPGGDKKGATKWHFFARRRAWVKLDAYAFKTGDVLRGSLYAETTPNTRPEEAGTMKGKFEAKICNIGW